MNVIVIIIYLYIYFIKKINNYSASKNVVNSG